MALFSFGDIFDAFQNTPDFQGTTNYIWANYQVNNNNDTGAGIIFIIEGQNGDVAVFNWHDDFVIDYPQNVPTKGQPDIKYAIVQASFDSPNNGAGYIDGSCPANKFPIINRQTSGAPQPPSIINVDPNNKNSQNNCAFIKPGSQQLTISSGAQPTLGSFILPYAVCTPVGGNGTQIALRTLERHTETPTYEPDFDYYPVLPGQYLTLQFQTEPKPKIQTIAPPEGGVGDTVTLTGVNFDTTYSLKYFSSSDPTKSQSANAVLVNPNTIITSVPPYPSNTGNPAQDTLTYYLVNKAGQQSNQINMLRDPSPKDYSPQSNEVSTPFSIQQGQVQYTVTVSGPSNVQIGDVAQYKATFIGKDQSGKVVYGPKDITKSTNTTWSSQRQNSFPHGNGRYFAQEPTGSDIITASYVWQSGQQNIQQGQAQPLPNFSVAGSNAMPILPGSQLGSLQNIQPDAQPDAQTYIGTLNITVTDQGVGTLELTIDPTINRQSGQLMQNTVYSDTPDQMHVFLTNPGGNPQEITASVTVTSTIVGTILPGNIYYNPNAEVDGTSDLCTVQAFDDNNNLLTATDTITTLIVYTSLLSIIPAYPAVQVSTTQQFTAQEWDPNKNKYKYPPVTWSVTNLDATGSIDQNGLFTALSVGAGASQVMVTAVTTDGSNLDGSTLVTVTNTAPGGGPQPIVRINPNNPTMQIGETTQFSVTEIDYLGNVTYPSCQWSVQNISGRGTITQTGSFTAQNAGAQVQVTAITDDQYAATAITTVHINALPSVVQMEVQPGTKVVNAGIPFQFTVTGFDSDGQQIVPIVSWSIDNVDGTGVIDPVSGLFTGQLVGSEVTVIAETPIQPDGLTVTAQAQAVVVPGPLYKLIITPVLAQTVLGTPVQFGVLGYDYYNNVIVVNNVVWGITGNIGTIDQTGFFTPVNNGVGFVTAAVGSISTEAQVVVLETVGGIIQNDLPQQPFGRIHVKELARTPAIVDTRTRGGGVKIPTDILHKNEFWWDISSFDGTPFQAYGVYIVKVGIPSTFSGATSTNLAISPANIMQVLSQYAAPQFLGIILPGS